MSLTKCAECGKEISDMAQACPHCGCPLMQNGVLHFHWGNMKGNTFLKTTVLVDGNEVGTMKCSEYLDLNVSPGNYKIELYFRDKCAVSEIVEISPNHLEEYYAYKQTLTGLKRVPANSVKWNKPLEKGATNIPKCPTCGSTNIKRLSLTGKVFSVEMVGLASNSVGKTFVCKNCKYKW